MPRKPRIPSYRHHKPTNRAVVTLGGHDYYLGAYDSPQSHTEYRRLIAEWFGSGQAAVAESASPNLTVDELFDRYWAYAEGYYPPRDGDSGSQLVRVASALGYARQLYAKLPARQFSPTALRAVRQRMIEADLVRRYINQLVDCIRRAFTWAASYELVPVTVPQALGTVEGLRAGRSQARESEPVTPAPEDAIEAVRERVLPTVRDIIDFQLLTATRPGEILRLQDVDIDRSGEVWQVKATRHKTRWRGHERTIWIGPQAQEIVRRRTEGKESPCYLFSAIEAVEARYREIGFEGRLSARQKRRPGPYYRGQSYARAIAKACAKADVTHWHPHQLRHNAATRLVAEFGWETARIILGHRGLDATRIYALDDAAKAVAAVRKIG